MENALEYIEVRADNAERSSALFATVFGWEIQQYGAGYCSFKTPAGLAGAGGAFTVEESRQDQPQLAYITVSDIDAKLGAVAANGGKTTVPKTLIDPSTGWFAQFTDPGGVLWGLYQKPAAQ